MMNLSISVADIVENDFCENAESISLFGSTLRPNLLSATVENLDDVSFCDGTYYKYPGVWYTFVGNGKRVAVRQLGSSCDYTEDLAVLFFSGGCNLANINCERGSADLCSQRFLFPTERGKTYHVLVKFRYPERNLKLKIATCGLFHLGIFCPPTLYETLSYLFQCLIRESCL